MMRKQSGFSLLELLIVIGILGILLSLVASALPRDRFAVNQAAQGLAAQVVRARLEALRLNTGVGLQADQNTQRYFLFIDKDSSYSYTTGDELISGATVVLAQGEHAGVRLNSSATLVFDARGMLRNVSGDTVLSLSNPGNSYAKQVRVSLQGRSSVL